MYKVILLDGTEITNCIDGTTSDCIKHSGATFAEAAEVMDLVTAENTQAIRVEDEEGNVVASAGDLVLLSGGTMSKEGSYCVCTITLRHKTETEIMKEEIAELQDVVLEG